MSKTLLLGLTLLLSGCHFWHRVPDWPTLTIIEHRVSADEIHRRCGKYMKWYQSALACAEWNFSTRECHIWLEVNVWEFIRQHEIRHCQGWMHS
jgi:hypothetical protein